MIKIKDIVGYEGLYKVDSEGNVYNKNGLMTANQVVNGYKRIALSKGNKSRKHLVHRLVAVAFIENLENKRCVNHKNLNKEDNRLINLEWVTHGENINHANVNGRDMGARVNIENLKKINELMVRGLSIPEIAESLNIKVRSVYNFNYRIKKMRQNNITL